ncbi:transposase [Rubrobacter xylanophilus]|uniref:transposase n=1 Tax=Rubrobacter xylanophilus TaxID=49319 RepID=UPI0038CD7DE5
MLEAEMTEHVGAAFHERTDARKGHQSLVSSLAGRLDAELAAWRSRPLQAQAYPYLLAEALNARRCGWMGGW